jgi:hypothetical protein
MESLKNKLSSFKLNTSINKTILKIDLKNEIDQENQRALSYSNFRRGIVKTNDSYFYYILNETQSNSYSYTYSAIKYEIDEEKQQINVSPDNILIKFYPKYLIKDYFSDSQLIDMQFECLSKYKNLGKNHKQIQEVHEMIIRDDCILVVVEKFDNSLKDFLDENDDICDEFQENILPPRKEWYFTRLIYDIVTKLNELKRYGIFFGTLININDIAIRNFKVNLKDKYGFDQAMLNIEDVEFVLPNPFLYEIETIFMMLDNNITTKVFPPEMLERFIPNSSKPNILEKTKEFTFFTQNDQSEKELEIKLKTKESILEQRNLTRRFSSLPSSRIQELQDNHKENKDVFLGNDQEKTNFDSWMLGLLIYQILQNRLPENISLLEDIEKVKNYYSIASQDLKKTKLPGATDLLGSLFAHHLLKVKKNVIGLEYFFMEISVVMRKIIGDAMKLNPKYRIYPSFDDCTNGLKIVDSIDQSMTESFLTESLNINDKSHKTVKLGEEDKELVFFKLKKEYITIFLDEYDPDNFDKFHLDYFWTPNSKGMDREKFIKLKKHKETIPLTFI